jgi:hypothetical protein
MRYLISILIAISLIGCGSFAWQDPASPKQMSELPRPKGAGLLEGQLKAGL